MVGRRDRPNVRPGSAQPLYQIAHLREDSGRNSNFEVFIRGALDLFFAQVVIHGRHLAAHHFFRHVAGLVVGVARPRPALDLFGNHASLHRPVKEAFAGVARPKGTVAVKCRDRRTESKDTGNEFRLFGSEFCHLDLGPRAYTHLRPL